MTRLAELLAVLGIVAALALILFLADRVSARIAVSLCNARGWSPGECSFHLASGLVLPTRTSERVE